MQGSHHIKTMSVEEPTGKLKFAYTTIANMEAKIKSQQQELDKLRELLIECKHQIGVSSLYYKIDELLKGGE